MKAYDAAAEAASENLTVDAVKALMPDYQNPLHRRQWVANFIKFLPEEIRDRYRDLIKI